VRTRQGADAIDRALPITDGWRHTGNIELAAGPVCPLTAAKRTRRTSDQCLTKRKSAPRLATHAFGPRLDLLDPSPLDVEISDIAQGLARVARWNGQTRGDHAFSVAQHSLMVEDDCRESFAGSRRTLRLALLHDAPEYVIGDMISPFKAVVGGGYKAVEARLEAAIHIRFGLPPDGLDLTPLPAADIQARYLSRFAEVEAAFRADTPRSGRKN
jgi:5'-deoxynucleotidase YfbR-like HD superfamily hydrolase